MPNIRNILQNRNLTLLWLGQMASQSGDTIFHIGLLWLALELSGSEAVTGLVAMASYLPAVVLSLGAGAIADRSDRRRIMLTSDGFRMVVILAIPLGHYFGILSPVLLGVTAFALAIAATFFNPARDALIPQIVPREGLVRANSLVQTSWQFSLLLGPAAAGLLLHLVGNIHLFSFDSLAYLLSFALVYLISARRPRPAQPPAQTAFRDVIDGLGYVLKQPVILPLLLLTVADNIFIMGPALVGTPVFIKRELGLGADAYALIQGCYAVGMLLGTAALLGWGSRFGKGRVLLVGMILDGITFVPIFWSNSLTSLAIIIIIHSLAIPLLTVSRASLIQSVVPVNLTGRVFALVNLAVVGMSALSAGASGFALQAVGARVLFPIIGIGGAFCGVVGWVFATHLRKQE